MSVLIKGAGMPASCMLCFFNSRCKAFSNIDNGHHPTLELVLALDLDNKRLDDCLLVEVKTPHGRLIDAGEAFIDADERGFDFWASDADIDSAKEFLKVQPTIIEAEEGVENNG